MNGVTAVFYDDWTWLVFVSIGLLMIVLELLLGVDTGLDLVFLGSAFAIGGLITWPMNSWIITLIVSSIFCVAYVGLGRRYVHRWKAARIYKTNIDTIIGKSGLVIQPIFRNVDGLVKVGNEEWRARALKDIEKGTEIVVRDIKGVTLVVEENAGGQQE